MKKEDIPLIVSEVKDYLLGLQHAICKSFAAEDDLAEFETYPWEQDSFGEGITRVISNGQVFEKGGVNFSHVFGNSLPVSATQNRPHLAGCSFQVLGVSVVMHPRNPYVPTSHANVRLFIAQPEEGNPVWWFGGGFDLTPYYGFEEDCIHWHQTAEQACKPLAEDTYSIYKKLCDEYFFLKHRNEPRGIGGLFFDDLNNSDFDTCFEFMRNVGNGYIQAYQPIVAKRKCMSYGERERQFQLYRRGRYVEFNLIYDRGTLFGLQTQGRTESILMSLPPVVNWGYNWKPEKNSIEEQLYTKYIVI